PPHSRLYPHSLHDALPICHGRLGGGNGLVVQRGFSLPPTFHSDRLRAAPVGHFFDVITNGFGAMPDYRSQIPVRDRWAIIAYIRDRKSTRLNSSHVKISYA